MTLRTYLASQLERRVHTLAPILAFLLVRPVFAQHQTTRFTAVVDVNVVDVEQGAVLPPQTILIEQNRIAWLGPTGQQRLPAGTTIIRAPGEYAIPGLWDMHIHLTSGESGTTHPTVAGSKLDRVADYYRDVLLSAGVTGVRDMGGDL